MSFPRYAAYRDSGVAWLGDVPAHWAVMPIKRLAFLQSGESITAERIDESGDFPVYGGNGLRGYTNAFTHAGEFVLIGRQGALCGNINYGYRKFWASEHAVVVTPTKSLTTKWLGEVLRAMNLNQYSVSAAQPGLSVEAVAQLMIPVPLREEQAAIATFLDHETAKIDALVDVQKRLIELLKEKRQAVISQAVTKGLDPNVPMKDSGVEWLGEVPGHWELGGLTRFIGPVVDYRGRTPTKVDEGVFLVTARNIQNGKIDYTASEEYVDAESAGSLLDRGRPEMGDLLFTMEAPLGQVALIDRTDIALAQRIVKFRGRQGVLQSDFLLYWFMGDHCQARLMTLATGSTALGIKASKLGMIECLVPPLDEQAEIVQFVEREFEALDALVEQAEVASLLLVERRAALISAAVTGKIDVRGLARSTDKVAASAHKPPPAVLS